MGKAPIVPLVYDSTRAFLPATGLTREDMASLAPRLNRARAQLLADGAQWTSGGESSAANAPRDVGFIHLPERLLEGYRQTRNRSELGRILLATRRLAKAVDRVVVLGSGAAHTGARALFEGCCHPYHNEFTRGERGGRPRMYFVANTVDNDALQGLLDLVNRSSTGSAAEDRWGIIVSDAGGQALETSVALRILLRALSTTTGGAANQIADLVIPVAGADRRLSELATALNCPDVFQLPDGVDGPYAVLTAVSLLPAVMMGLDIMALLEGAAAMNERFKNTPVGKNPVLEYVGATQLMQRDNTTPTRVLSTWGQGLEAIGQWHDQLLTETSDRQPRQTLGRDKLITNLIVDNVRRDRLSVGDSELDQDQLNALADKTLPQIMSSTIDVANEAHASAGRPTADLRLSQLDESSLGQLFQMLMLATAVERRMGGDGTDGQPYDACST